MNSLIAISLRVFLAPVCLALRTRLGAPRAVAAAVGARKVNSLRQDSLGASFLPAESFQLASMARRFRQNRDALRNSTSLSVSITCSLTDARSSSSCKPCVSERSPFRSGVCCKCRRTASASRRWLMKSASCSQYDKLITSSDCASLVVRCDRQRTRRKYDVRTFLLASCCVSVTRSCATDSKPVPWPTCSCWRAWLPPAESGWTLRPSA